MADERFRNVLLDTGPLVAVLNQHDSAHRNCIETLTQIDGPLLTCWPVLTEAAWLLRSSPPLVSKMLMGPRDGVFALLPIQDEELDEIDTLRERYANLQPQLADLALYHLALREGFDTVFTLDRRDFTVFRQENNRPFRLLPE